MHTAQEPLVCLKFDKCELYGYRKHNSTAQERQNMCLFLFKIATHHTQN